MNVTQFLLEVRDMLDDPDDLSGSAKVRWDDGVLMRHANRTIRGLVRKQMELDQGFHNCAVLLSKEDAIQVHSNVWDYILPTWSMRVAGVREQATDSQPEPDFIQPADRRTSGRGGPNYHMVANTTLRLRHANALDLQVDTVKLPARMTRGTVGKPSTGVSGTIQLYMEPDEDAEFPNETEANSYRNAIVELTGTDSPTHIISGAIARVTASSHRNEDASKFYTLLTLDKALPVPPAANDTYEFQTEIAEEHVRLLILLVCRACWESKGNNDELRAIAGELNEEWVNYLQHIQPRQGQEPDFIRTNRRRATSSTYDDAPAIDILG